MMTNGRRLRRAIAAVSVALLAFTSTAGAASVGDDFEKESVDTPIASQGTWQASAQGQHPASSVRQLDLGGRSGRVLQSGGGENRDLFVPSAAAWKAIAAAPAIVVSFDFIAPTNNAGGEINVGRMASVPDRAFGVSFGRQLQLKAADGTVVQSLLTFEPKQWYQVQLAIQPDPASPLKVIVSVGTRNLSAGEKQTAGDYSIQNISVDISKLTREKWSGLEVRLDVRMAIDNLRVESATRSSATSSWTPPAEPKPAFEPFLDYIAPPRAAQSLNGIWKTAPGEPNVNTPPAQARWQSVLVPAQHEALFSQAKDRPVWFKRLFDVPADWKNDHVWLNFERLTDQAYVCVNGELITKTDDGYWPFGVDITSAIRFGEANEIEVGVLSPTATNAVGHRPVGWIWYYSTFTGIPFPVHIERRPVIYVDDVYIRTTVHDGTTLKADATIQNPTNITRKIRVTASAGDEFQAESDVVSVPAHGSAAVTFGGAWDHPHLWWPYDPYLYTLEVQIHDAATPNAAPIDARRTRFGFREIRVDGKDFILNDRRFTHRRQSLISYWPSVRDAALDAYMKSLSALGYVGLRLHGGAVYRVVRKADELGLLITPETGLNTPRGYQVQDDFWPAAEKHILNMVRAMRNSPSVIYWSLSNEFASNYTPAGDIAKGHQVDQQMLKIGAKVIQLDPTRTFTDSGDLDLAGHGNNGPAPTLSLHYAWQPCKPENMLPTTAYWLDQGLRPWQGVQWKRDKPIILSEDLYGPYAFQPPHGMTQWAGDAAYDGAAGQNQAWFDAYRTLADGYYHAGVAGWNPWGVKDEVAAIGQLMPDYLIAAQPFTRSFQSDATVSRTVYVYNQLFRDLKAQLKSELLEGDRVVASDLRSFDFAAGSTQTLAYRLRMPDAQTRTTVKWHLMLTAGGKVLTERTYDYSVFPRSAPLRIPSSAALVTTRAGNSSDPLLSASFDHGVFNSVAEAVARSPQVIVIDRYALTQAEGVVLDKAVRGGMRVLWLEVPPESWLPSPLQIDANHFAAHAFVRSPHDRLTADLSDADLSCWGDDTYVTHHALFKPTAGRFSILIDAGSPHGMTAVPLLRFWEGKGDYLICQMPVISKSAQEPAALALLNTLLADCSLPPLAAPAKRLIVLADAQSPLLARLQSMNIPFDPAVSPKQEGVLLVDTSKRLDPAAIALIQARLAADGDVICHRLSRDSAASLSAVLPGKIAIAPANDVQQLLRIPTAELLDGLSNDDLYWIEAGNNAPAMITGTVSGDAIVALTRPAGLAMAELRHGRLIIDQVRWDEADLAQRQPLRSARFAVSLLHNAGADVGDTSATPVVREPIDLRGVANRGFADQPGNTSAPPGWFNAGADDMRYFPVNRTGIDPQNKLPAPLESFPTAITCGGVTFDPIDPEKNAGRSVLVLGTENVALHLQQPITRLWMLGAMAKNVEAELPVATVTWHYVDGTTAISQIVAGVDVGCYQGYQSIRRGRLGWSGYNGTRDAVVQYVWDVQNPKKDSLIQSVDLRANNGPALAITAITSEASANR